MLHLKLQQSSNSKTGDVRGHNRTQSSHQERRLTALLKNKRDCKYRFYARYSQQTVIFQKP
jgi:hypothetical protein